MIQYSSSLRYSIFILALDCFFSLSFAAENNTVNKPQTEASADPFVIGGRPEAPLLQMDTLSAPSIPFPEKISGFGELDYADLVRNPELLFMYGMSDFDVNMQKLRLEVEQILPSEGNK